MSSSGTSASSSALVTTASNNQSSLATYKTTSGHTLLQNDPHRSAQQLRQREQLANATVLDDETYVNNVRAIIERDFFPDLHRLRARAEWIEARERNDLPMLVELRRRYGSKRRDGAEALRTPRALQTPRNDAEARAFASLSAEQLPDAVEALPSLNEFVAMHVNEDDAAYAELAESDHRKFRERTSWLEEAAVTAQRQIEAPSNAHGRIKAWPFDVRNALMWYPHAIDDPAQLAAAADSAKAITKTNTRFAVPAPVNKKRRVAVATNEDTASTATEARPSAKDEADQYGFVKSPSPSPGVDVAPIMTWGKIASTPQRVRENGDASDRDDSDDGDSDDEEDEKWMLATFGTAENGPAGQFRVQQTPIRDAVAHDLANAVHERRVRATQQRAAQTRRAASADGRRVGLSPAAARLAHTLTPRRTPLQSDLSLSAALRKSYSTPRATPLSTPLPRR